MSNDSEKDDNLTETTLAKLGFPRLEKLCDAKFVKSFFKTTKKDFALFVSENDEVRDFLSSLEEKMVEADDEYREMIQEYMESISDDINKFKTHLKELQRKKKLNILETQKKLLREEILRELEAEKKKQEIIDKLGIKPQKPESSFKKHDSDNESDVREKDKEEQETPKPAFKFKSKNNVDKPIDNINKSNKSKDIDKKSIDQDKDKEDSYQKSIDLNEFYAFLKEVIKNDLLIIKHESGRMKIKDIDLDNDVIKIKVE